eukprot:gene39339-48604_t
MSASDDKTSLPPRKMYDHIPTRNVTMHFPSEKVVYESNHKDDNAIVVEPAVLKAVQIPTLVDTLQDLVPHTEGSV